MSLFVTVAFWNLKPLITSSYACTSFSDLRKILLDGIIDLIGSISNLNDTKLVNILLFGDDTFSMETNLSILKLTISFLKESERFDMPLVL